MKNALLGSVEESCDPPCTMVVRHCLARGLGVIVCLLLGSTARAATNVPGGVLGDQTWVRASSPYIVAGDITVPSGKSLVIEPGVEVQLAPSSDKAADPSGIGLYVDGSLDAEGTAAAPITFRPLGATWVGIQAKGAVVMRHFEIEGAVGGIFARFSFSPRSIILANGTIEGGNQGVVVEGGSVLLDGLTIDSAGLGIFGDAPFTIKNSLLRHCGFAGIELRDSGEVKVVNTTLHANEIGIKLSTWTPEPLPESVTALQLKNSILTKNGTGISDVTSGPFHASAVMSYTDVWGNNHDYDNVAPGVGCFSSDPLYVAAPLDLRLKAGSPCIDVGTPDEAPATDIVGTARPLDGDGSGGAQFDLGAYEFAGAPDRSESAGAAGVTGEAGAAGAPGAPGAPGAGRADAGAADTTQTEQGGGSAAAPEAAAGGEAGNASAATAGSQLRDDAESSSCGCRIAGAPAQSALWIVAMLVAAAGAQRRRARS